LPEGEDLVVAGWERCWWWETVLGRQFQHRLACGLQPVQGPLGNGELLAEPGDFVTQPCGGLADQPLPVQMTVSWLRPNM